MNKKRIFSLILASVVSMSLLGCSSNRDLSAPVDAPFVKNSFKPKYIWSDSFQGADGLYNQLKPAIFGENLYIAGRDGKVYSVVAANGDSVWKTDLSDEEENDTKRSARISGGVSVCNQYVAVGSENGYLYVLNRQNGSLYFKNYIGTEIVTAPAFSESGSTIFVLDSNGGIHAFDLMTREKMWVSGDSSHNLHLRSQSRPIAVGDEILIVGTPSGRVMIISQLDGFILSQVTVGQNNGSSDLDRISDVSSTPLLLGNNMYTTAYNAGFVQYSFAKEAIIGRLAYHSSKDIAYDENYFVITGDNGHIHCVRRADNVEVWTNTALSNRNVTPPTIYGNYVVVGDYEGYIYFISLDTGKIETKLDHSVSPIYVAPLISGNNIILCPSDGRIEVYRYDPQNIVAAKQQYNELERTSGTASAIIASHAMSATSGGGVTEELLEQRRAEARRIVAQIDAQQRRAEAQYREYQRRKAEYERQVKAYEAKKREELSGFGLAPDAGVKSDSDVEFVEDDSQ